MSLVVLRRFAMLSEAQAAAAALRASGVHAVLLDHAGAPPYSGMPVSGFRLAIPEAEAKAANEVLHDALASAREEVDASDERGRQAGANPPVMPLARRAGRLAVWALFALATLSFARSL